MLMTLRKEKIKKEMVLPKSVFYILVVGFVLYIVYLAASLIGPDGVVDEYISNLPLWLKVSFFLTVGGYLVFDFLNSIYGSVNKD